MLRGNLACVQICTAVKAPNAPGTPVYSTSNFAIY